MNELVLEKEPLYFKILGCLLITYAVVSPISLSATNISLALIYLAGLIALINNKANNRSANIRSLFLVYIVLFSWAGFTALIAKGFIVKTDISNLWEYSIILFLPVFLQVTSVKKEKIIFTLIICSSIVSFLGILQYFCPSLTYPFPRQLVKWRFTGFFSISCHASGFFSIITILTLALILFWECRMRYKIYLWILFSINLLAFSFSMARAYYVSIALIIPVILLLKNVKWFVLGNVFFILVLIATLSFPNLVKVRIESILSRNMESNKERIYLWKSSIRMAKDHPLTGIGPNSWGTKAAEKYIDLIKKETGFDMRPYGHAHNSYLTWLSESGIPGLLLFLLFWFMVVKRLFYVKSTVAISSFDYALIVGTLGGLGNLFIAGLFEHNFGTSVILLLISFLIGLSLTPNEEIAENEMC